MGHIPPHLVRTFWAIGITWVAIALLLSSLIAWRTQTRPADALPSSGLPTALVLVLGNMFIGALFSDILDALLGVCMIAGSSIGAASALIVIASSHRKRKRVRRHHESELLGFRNTDDRQR